MNHHKRYLVASLQLHVQYSSENASRTFSLILQLWFSFCCWKTSKFCLALLQKVNLKQRVEIRHHIVIVCDHNK